MVLATWFLVQNSQLVGQLLGGFGAVFIGGLQSKRTESS